MSEIRVIVYGVGGIGSGIVRALASKKGVKLVGGIDGAPFKIGEDLGKIAGIDDLGIKIVGSPEDLLAQGVEADVIIDTGTPVNARKTFERMKWAIERKMNVLVACAEVSNLWFTDPETAKDVDEYCKKYGVSFVGMGALQVLERLIIHLTEGNTAIDSIESLHHADTTAFGAESKAAEYGITLTKEEYEKGCADGTVKDKEELKDSIPYICAQLGWEIDKVTLEKKVSYGDDGRIYAFNGTVKGYSNGELKITMTDEMMDDPEHRYFDHFKINGVSAVDCVINYTPDRGVISTQAPLINAIPQVIKLQPGYINTLSLSTCNILLDDYTKHL